MGDELDRYALHEAGHLVAAHACGWRLHGASVAGGAAFAGCALAAPPVVAGHLFDGLDLDAPLMLWPCALRQRLERHVIMLMAGELAVELAARPVRLPLPVADRAAGRARELPAPSPQVAARLAAVMDDPGGEPDDEAIATLARAAHGRDHSSAATWLAHMEAQTRALLAGRLAEIERLVDVLVVRRSLDGEQVAALLERP